MLLAADTEHMLATHREKQRCPPAKDWFPHLHERATALHFFRDATGKAEKKRANRSLPVPNPPPPLAKSQAIQHLQVKLL